MVFTSGVPCVIAGCGRPSICKGLCRVHYDRQRYSGSPIGKVRMRVCLNCLKPIELVNTSQKFCSAYCRVKYFRRKRRGEMVAADVLQPFEEFEPFVSDAAPGLSYGGFSEADVWAKCDGTCFGCGLPVSRNVEDVNAGTPGWIIPPEDGGDTTLANRAIFHYACVRRHVPARAEREARHGRKAGGHHGGKRKEGR